MALTAQQPNAFKRDGFLMGIPVATEEQVRRQQGKPATS